MAKGHTRYCAQVRGPHVEKWQQVGYLAALNYCEIFYSTYTIYKCGRGLEIYNVYAKIITNGTEERILNARITPYV